MVSVSTALSALAIAAVATSTSVDAHGTLAKPALKFTGTAYAGDFSALVPMTTLKPQPGDKWGTMNAHNDAAAFGRAFKASEYKSFKEFILKNQDLSKGRFSNPKTPECGFTDPTSGPVSALPDQLEWYGGVMNHPGPCEVWCDDEIVVPFTPDCALTYPQGKFKYDKEKCVGKNRLTMYWMSTLLEWQVYIDCAKIGNGTPAAAPAGAPKPAPAPAPAAGPAPGPAAPASKAPAPAPAPAPKPAAPAPAPAPKPAAPAPAPAKGDTAAGEANSPKKCNRRLRD